MLEGLSVNMLPMNQGLGATAQEPDPAQGFMPKLPAGWGGRDCTQVVVVVPRVKNTSADLNLCLLCCEI